MFSRKSLFLFVVSFIGFIDFLGIGLVYPMFSSMFFQENSLFLSSETSDAVRGAWLGILLSVMPLTQFFSAPILGMLSDRFGRKKIILPSLIMGLIGYLVACFAVTIGSLSLLMLSRVGVGIAGGTVSAVQAALADKSTVEDKAKNFGVFNMALGLGFTVGPLLGGFFSGIDLGYISGYSVAFLAAAFIVLVNIVSVIFFFEETYVPTTKSEFTITQGILNIKKAFFSSHLRFFFFSVFFACVGWSFYWEFTPVTWIKEFHFDAVTIGQCYAYGAIFFALSSGILIRPIVSCFPNQFVLLAALMGCACSIGMLLIHTNPLALWVYIPLQQFSMALFWPTAGAVISNSVSEAQQGEALGILHSVDALAFAVSPLIAGPLLGIGNFMPIAVGMGTMVMAVLLLSLSLRQKASLETLGS